MNADAITKRIIEDAKEAAGQTLKEADERAQKVRERAEAEVQAQRKKALEKAKLDCAELRDRMLRMAELDQRKEMLAMKREVIDAAFEDALKKMRQMKPDMAKKFNRQMLIASAGGDEKIVIAKSDEALFDAAFLADVNAQLAKAGKAGNLTLSNERRELGGGFVLTRGGLEVNCTYRAVLNQARPALEAEVAGMLFAD